MFLVCTSACGREPARCVVRMRIWCGATGSESAQQENYHKRAAPVQNLPSAGEVATASDAEFPECTGPAASVGGASVAGGPGSGGREEAAGGVAAVGNSQQFDSPGAPPGGGLSCVDYAAVYRFLGALHFSDACIAHNKEFWRCACGERPGRLGCWRAGLRRTRGDCRGSGGDFPTALISWGGAWRRSPLRRLRGGPSDSRCAEVAQCMRCLQLRRHNCIVDWSVDFRWTTVLSGPLQHARRTRSTSIVLLTMILHTLESRMPLDVSACITQSLPHENNK